MNSVFETENELDFRTVESDGQNRLGDPYNETRLYMLFV